MTTKDTIRQNIMDAFYFRHACKKFDSSKKISDDDFQFILETGRLSPSSYGYEPWKFIVLQNQKIREKLLPYAGGAQGKETASHFVIVLARNSKDMHYDSDYIRYMNKEIIGLSEQSQAAKYKTFKKFQETDFNLCESSRAMFDWASKQTYIALANMMNTAAQIGIDSCPIEGFNKEGVESVLRNEGILKGDHFEVSVMVAFGYRQEEPKSKKTRKPLNEIVEWY